MSPGLRHLLSLCCVFLFIYLSNGTRLKDPSPEELCYQHFISGTPPVLTSAPTPSTKRVPLCHYKGKSTFFYNLYDETLLHGLYTASLLNYSKIAKASGGRRAFAEDPQLKELGAPQVNPEKKDTGYGAIWNRGHLGPSEVFSFDKTAGGAWDQCYYSTNIAPQDFQFNQIGWRILEANIFNWVLKNKRDIWVYTGTYYDGSAMRTLKPSGVGIPNFYYKVICDGYQSAAFAGKNELHHPGMESIDYIPVAKWQQTTGFNFNFPDSCQINSVNPAYWNFTSEVPPHPVFSMTDDWALKGR